MKRIYVIMLSALLPLGLMADGYAGKSFVENLQQRDSVLIADQLKYGVRLSEIADGSEIFLPQVKDTLSAQMLVVQPWKTDTVRKRGRTKDIEASLVITTFDDGEYVLPDIPVLVRRPDGQLDSLMFEGQDVLFCSMPVDTATFKIHPLKAQMRYPITFRECLPWIGGALVLAAIIAVLVYFLRKRRKAIIEAQRHDPPHIVALRKLDAYRGDKYWVPAKQKAFYSGVTDALREYICARYDVSAMEMTTGELFKALKKSDIPEDLKADLKEMFERSDFVKFAKYVASDEENAGVLPLGVRFVTSTYQEEIEGESKNVL